MPYTVVDKGSKYFDTKLYTGTGATQSITGLNFAPDWVWIKDRTNAYGHDIYDVIRTATYRIQSNDASAESTASGLTSFNSDGFTLGSYIGNNTNTANYVSWNWKANGTGVSNTAGTITSTVSANTTSGFSIVSYTGVNGSKSVGHGLGVVPKMIIAKSRTSADNWLVYHHTQGQGNLRLNLTNATSQQSPNPWSATAPSSSVFNLDNSGSGWLNNTGDTYIAYCFADVKGYSKFGSYTGNGSTDGTFVYTGFKPAFVLTKASSSTGQWIIHDTARDTFNQANRLLYPSLSNAEENNISDQIDILSNGFKIKATGSAINGSGVTYIYMAFAENPFVSSKGIPTTAR